ncbi:MAG TPA: hypothetical protein VMF58_04450 [Rhizomicrobium sp.]|nr:hypothetical protein [Rhizomicrobium sp.]
MLKWVKRIALIVAGLFALFFLWLMLMKHNIKFYGHETFATAGGHLSIEATEGLAGRYGVVQIWRDGSAVHVLLQSKQWDSVVDFWESARATQSEDWRVVGTVAEPSGSSPARFTISAGHSVRFKITASHGCATFDLAPSDFDRFERSSRNIQRYAANGGVVLPVSSMSWADAFHSTVVTIGSLVGIPEQQAQACDKS